MARISAGKPAEATQRELHALVALQVVGEKATQLVADFIVEVLMLKLRVSGTRSLLSWHRLRAQRLADWHEAQESLFDDRVLISSFTPTRSSEPHDSHLSRL